MLLFYVLYDIYTYTHSYRNTHTLVHPNELILKILKIIYFLKDGKIKKKNSERKSGKGEQALLDSEIYYRLNNLKMHMVK